MQTFYLPLSTRPLRSRKGPLRSHKLTAFNDSLSYFCERKSYADGEGFRNFHWSGSQSDNWLIRVAGKFTIESVTTAG